MATTTARNQQDVDKMSAKDRLWDSLDYTYNQRGEKISKEYDKARSAADRTLLSRGMQRSSYGAQTLANVDMQRADALAENEADKIADYENRLQTIEQQELQQSNFERQFAENQRQFNAGQEFTRSENALKRAQEQAQFDANLGFNRERAGVQDAQWERAFDYQAGRDAVADEQWEKTYNQADRQFALEYAKALLAAEQPVPSSLLIQAGLKISNGQVVPVSAEEARARAQAAAKNAAIAAGNKAKNKGGSTGNGTTDTGYKSYSASDLSRAADSFKNNSRNRVVYNSFSLKQK